MSPLTVRSDDRICETKNIFVNDTMKSKLKGGDASSLLSLKDSGRLSSRVE